MGSRMPLGQVALGMSTGFKGRRALYSSHTSTYPTSPSEGSGTVADLGPPVLRVAPPSWQWIPTSATIPPTPYRPQAWRLGDQCVETASPTLGWL